MKHHYREMIDELARTGKLDDLPKGTVIHMAVMHDDWCPIWDKGTCNCFPTILRHIPGHAGETPDAYLAQATR